MNSTAKVGNRPMNKWLNFGVDPDHRLDTGIVFRICHYWEIRKVVKGHKSAAHTGSPDGGTGKICLVPVLLVVNTTNHGPALFRLADIIYTA